MLQGPSSILVPEMHTLAPKVHALYKPKLDRKKKQIPLEATCRLPDLHVALRGFHNRNNLIEIVGMVDAQKIED